MGAIILAITNEVTSGAPTAAEIESVLRSIPVNGNQEFKLSAGIPGGAGFVGSARITRVAYLAPPGGRITRVAWLYLWPDPPGATVEQIQRLTASVASYLRANVSSVLSSSGIGASWSSRGWSAPQTLPYDPAVNGSVDWWRSGQAARTVTRDGFDLNQQTGATATLDNPTGPTTTHLPTAVSPVEEAAKALKVLGWIALGITALVYLGPAIGTVASRAASRKNPRKRRV